MLLGIFLCFLPMICGLLLFKLAFKMKLSHGLIACLLGLIVVLPISFIEYFLPSLPQSMFSPVVYTLIKSILIYGFAEELLKMSSLFALPHKNYTVFQFLMISFLMGLSLGCFETAVYFFDHMQLANTKGAQLLYSQISLRIATSDIIHTCCAGLSGLFVLTCRKDSGLNQKISHKFSYFIIAVLLHGIYDFFAGFSTGLKWFSLAVVLMAVVECRLKYISLTSVEEQKVF